MSICGSVPKDRENQVLVRFAHSFHLGCQSPTGSQAMIIFSLNEKNRDGSVTNCARQQFTHVRRIWPRLCGSGEGDSSAKSHVLLGNKYGLNPAEGAASHRDS